MTEAEVTPGSYDRDRDTRPGHVTALRSNRADGAWGQCSCGWLTPIGLFIGTAASAITEHLRQIDDASGVQRG